jgi:chloride channel protein, CIC family
MQKFDTNSIAILPVTKYGKFYGFLSKSSILEAYRTKLKEMVIE